jgi:predicted DsbA family dithiol-disulfide isomerase
MTKELSKIVIDVISDFACPWCYVGFMRLENAIDKFKDMKDVKEKNLDVEVRWHPYMIDMRTEPNGEPYMDYNHRRWGSDGWVAGMKKTARLDGCKFENWGNQNPDSMWANTLDAHRLMHFVRKKHGWSKIHSFKKLIFQCYYEKGWNISDMDVLIEVGVLGGLDKQELEQYFNSDAGTPEVMEEDERAKHETHVSAVPYFTVRGLPAKPFSGAQSTDFWLGVFEHFLEQA